MSEFDTSDVETMKRVRVLLLAGMKAPPGGPVDALYFAKLRLRAASMAKAPMISR